MTTEWQPSADLEVLRARAEMLARIRLFFAEQGVMEVETPVLSKAAVTDPNIHSLPLQVADGVRYLHTSPEFPMKRLLCSGSGDIYQICRVFRGFEQGRYHNPEFSMLEWYRLGMDHHDLMREVDELFHAIWAGVNVLPRTEFVSYAELIQRYSDKPFDLITIDDIAGILVRGGHQPPDAMPDVLDPWLDLLITHVIAPELPKDRFTAVYDFPPTQAALARIRHDAKPVAERFEMYFGELEIANGFHELSDADEQRARFEQDLVRRANNGEPEVPIDDNLIHALHAGLPDCAGVAIGLDRLLMVLCETPALQDVLSFDYDRA